MHIYLYICLYIYISLRTSRARLWTGGEGSGRMKRVRGQKTQYAHGERRAVYIWHRFARRICVLQGEGHVGLFRKKQV